MKHKIVMMEGKCPWCHDPCGNDHCAYTEDSCGDKEENTESNSPQPDPKSS